MRPTRPGCALPKRSSATTSHRSTSLPPWVACGYRNPRIRQAVPPMVFLPTDSVYASAPVRARTRSHTLAASLNVGELARLRAAITIRPGCGGGVAGSRGIRMKTYFPEIRQIKFEGTDSKNPLAFRHYNAKEKVL